MPVLDSVLGGSITVRIESTLGLGGIPNLTRDCLIRFDQLEEFDADNRVNLYYRDHVIRYPLRPDQLGTTRKIFGTQRWLGTTTGDSVVLIKQSGESGD